MHTPDTRTLRVVSSVALVASLTFLLGNDSCTQTGIAPLYTKETAVFDAALVGTWDVLGEDGKVTSTLTTKKRETIDGPAYAVEVTEKGKKEKWSYRAFVVEIAGARFLDAVVESKDREYAKEGSAPLHMYFRIDSTPDTVKLFTIENDAALPLTKLPTASVPTAYDDKPPPSSNSTTFYLADTKAVRAAIEAGKPTAFSKEILSLRRKGAKPAPATPPAPTAPAPAPSKPATPK